MADHELPRKKPDSSGRIIQYKFPKDYPIFWGANQRILEEGEYVEPEDWFYNESLVKPWVVRFIHDSGSVDSDLADGTAPGGGDPPDPEDSPWELYLVQTNIVTSFNPDYVGPYTTSVTAPCGTTLPGIELYSIGQYSESSFNTTVHLFISSINTCDHYVASEFAQGTAAALVGMGILKIIGYKVYFNWRKPTGPGTYAYFTTGGCPDQTNLLMSTPRTTPIYKQEFPWMVNPSAPDCVPP